MPFGLCNASSTFQVFINDILREYLDVFYSIYLNDILIYSDTRKKHIKHVRKILKKLQQVDLYLNINKCEFYTKQVKYLELIIIIKDLKMNFKKIKTVKNWKTLRCVKNIQAFLGFANFYRRFIHDYSRITTSLFNLTRIE